MKIWNKRKNKHKNRQNNNRVNIVLAIIFLLAAGLVYKLYDLQYIKCGYYVTLASGQHDVFSELEPKRGKIFIQDSVDMDSKSDFYPIATNKEFALVYAVPNMIKKEEAPVIAEQLYEILDKNIMVYDASTSTLMGVNASSTEVSNYQNSMNSQPGKSVMVARYLKSLTRENSVYAPLAKKVDEEKLNKLKELHIVGINYAMESYRFYPENNMGSHLIGFVGYSGDKKEGKYGLEGFFNDELSGKEGSIKTERDARGDWIILNNMDYIKPINGSDLILTINRSIQFTACEKLKESVMKHGADSGSVIVMDPWTGSIIAICSYPDYNPNEYEDVKNIRLFNNPAIFDQYEPGSVFKPLTMSAAINEGKVTPDTTYKDAGSLKINKWVIKNSDFETHGGHGVVDMNTVLEYSLNTGAIFAMQRIGAQVFSGYVDRYGFGERTGIELEGESEGNISNLHGKNIKDIYSATASFGQGISASPLQMINSYAVLANGGILMKPFLVKEIVHNDGKRDITKPVQIRRVITERTAALITGMLVNVVEKGHAKGAQLKGYYIGGKTGTAQVASDSDRGYGGKTIHTFIGFMPANDPKFVMLTKLDNPRDAKFAESTAVPLFADIAEFIVRYYQIPAERQDDQKDKK